MVESFLIFRNKGKTTKISTQKISMNGWILSVNGLKTLNLALRWF